MTKREHMTKREQKKKDTKEKLLIAASSCFAEKGYSACSVSDIVARAGMSQGSLYVHFSDKEDLFKSMIEEEHRQGAEKARRASCTAPVSYTHLDVYKRQACGILGVHGQGGEGHGEHKGQGCKDERGFDG